MNLETEQNYPQFNGAKVSQYDSISDCFYMNNLILTSSNIKVNYFCWTHVKEIPKTQFLVSLFHSQQWSANMELYEISKKGEVKIIYKFEELRGGKIFHAKLYAFI